MATYVKNNNTEILVSNKKVQILNITGEEWKPIEGYEKRYMISNLGRVKSLATIQHFTDKNGRKCNRKIKDHIIGQSITNCGYNTVILYGDDMKPHGYTVHRLVAKHFLPNFNTSLEVDHIDSNKQNNMLSNLQMVTRKQNMDKVQYHKRISVNKYDDNGNYICTYKSVAEAARKNNINGAKLNTYLKGKKNINIQGSYEFATVSDTHNIEYRIA